MEALRRRAGLLTTGALSPAPTARTPKSTWTPTRSSSSTDGVPSRRRQALRPKADRSDRGAPILGRGPALRRATVSGPTLQLYPKSIGEFEKWCRERSLKLRNLKEVDQSMENYFVALFCDGHQGYVGRGVLFGWILLRTDLPPTDKGALAGSRKALAVWLRRTPGARRDPCPLEVLWLMAQHCLGRGHGSSGRRLHAPLGGAGAS